MYLFIGTVIGYWLGYVAARPKETHWAVRLLSGAVAVLLLVAGAVGGVLSWFSGDGSGGMIGFGVAEFVGAVFGLVAGGTSSALAFAVKRGVISDVVSRWVGGGLAVAFMVVVFAWHRSESSKVSPEKQPIKVEKETVEKTGRTNDGGCLCFDSAVCVGPKGGKYCITQTGTKRYLTGEDQQRMKKN